ncbi:glyoxalase superfamily protein [Marivita sp.]|uniref:glyoxalase superfamily protein n=1 Tax=Marivita sp. TaxID=2003365 RepID=UPI003F6CE997
MTQVSVESVKTQAKALRQAMQTNGTAVTHAQALELIARQHGAHDWNTLRARLSHRIAAPELALEDRVSGHYLGQPFDGCIIALSGPAHLRQIEIKLDKPVDTVKFDSFSNWRHRIRGTLGEDGRSHRKTSNGLPQLIVIKSAP